MKKGMAALSKCPQQTTLVIKAYFVITRPGGSATSSAASWGIFWALETGRVTGAKPWAALYFPVCMVIF